jgi:hypothetical protein
VNDGKVTYFVVRICRTPEGQNLTSEAAPYWEAASDFFYFVLVLNPELLNRHGLREPATFERI